MPLNGKIDLRSDTFTQPTAAMRAAMSESIVGDDVWGLDPTVNELEKLAATLFGKEASLFLPSTCMGNLIAAMVHARGGEMLMGDKSHISLYEQGSVSTIGNVHARTLRNLDDGTFDLAELKQKLRPSNVHFPKTALVCLESSHNMCSGSVIGLDFVKAVRQTIGEGVRLHLDGARVFNALTFLGIDPATYVASFDSVSVCLSKGLGAPIGSLLLGSQKFIDSARRMRKALGGGMRQAGVIACCGLIALKDMTKRLHEDHENATALYNHLSKLPGISFTAPPQTNIVKFKVERFNMDGLCTVLAERNVPMITVDDGTAIRAVMHYHITRDDVDETARIFKSVLDEIAKGTLTIPNGSRLY